jgi:hypothetical protein
VGEAAPVKSVWKQRAGLVAAATMAILFLAGSVVGIRRMGGAAAAALAFAGFLVLVLLSYGKKPIFTT